MTADVTGREIPKYPRRNRSGEQADATVLSTTKGMPASWAIFEIASKSGTSSLGAIVSA